MLKIIIPKKFINEKKYIIEVFFEWILKIEYVVELGEAGNYIIQLSNGNEIEIADFFFGNNDESQSLSNDVFLPGNIKQLHSEYAFEESTPILFGENKIEKIEKDDNFKRFVLHGDLFGSAFFMLTRLEEFIKPAVDEHIRFRGRSSFAFKNHFINRPVVNEYAELIWNIMVNLGCDEKLRTEIGYKIIPTHDVDKVYYKFSWINFFADVFLDGNINRAIKRLRLDKHNYWDTFNWLMDQSEKNNLKSIFYFMADSSHKLDNRYSLKDPFILEKIKIIKERGHVVGIHPGYGTMDNQAEWSRQKKLLEDTTNSFINESRQHYLRFNISVTGRILENEKIKYDSSLGYPDVLGFRCGTSCEFPLYDVVNRKKLNVIERPLIIMETILRDRKNTEDSAINSIEVFDYYKSMCKKYKIPITILFHNNSFDPIRWNGWKKIYEENVLV
ncbi:MAG: polysaccharide deacetylase family protein [Melioribacteraceae bacterium]|nr:polysaccharide deacetylase family protein [Melioribacteraceae bacterium]MCF8355563.1 polysaccharide deacetylase family protein [Melioribacteraceae bacterium]MCF8394238.1 polysaccharide deacetylase family protein [Melioribacteraceae bacterium]MCF8419959.1 polysaccharide deacetylase family protein [Melioribacteraceae bacterium]